MEPENYDVRASIMWSATLALNGLIGPVCPQDWATHAGPRDHRPAVWTTPDPGGGAARLLQAKREQKRAKLLQYAERVWDLQQR